MSEIIRVENLSYIYNLGMPDATKALDDVSFTVEEGDFVGIIGSTGSGKSTLISHFNGLNRPTSGRVLVDGKDLWEQGADLRSFRFLVGLVMQYPEYQLFEETCAKDIAYGPRNMGLDEAEIQRLLDVNLGFSEPKPGDEKHHSEAPAEPADRTLARIESESKKSRRK